jgi:hypothetical protein
MPYVVRDPAGQIVEVHAAKTDRASEALAPDDPALADFVAPWRDDDVRGALNTSDLGFVRVLEDLIAVLIDKRIIALTDLPPAAQEKLSDRLRLRSRLADLEGIVGEPEEFMLP